MPMVRGLAGIGGLNTLLSGMSAGQPQHVSFSWLFMIVLGETAMHIPVTVKDIPGMSMWMKMEEVEDVMAVSTGQVWDSKVPGWTSSQQSTCSMQPHQYNSTQPTTSYR